MFEAPAEAALAAAALICAEMEQARPGGTRLRGPLKAEAGVGADWMAAK